MKTNFILQLVQRISMESPKFFKYIRWTAGVLAALLGAATALISHGLWHPDYADTINTIAANAWPTLTGIWAMSHLPVKDQSTYIKQS